MKRILFWMFVGAIILYCVNRETPVGPDRNPASPQAWVAWCMAALKGSFNSSAPRWLLPEELSNYVYLLKDTEPGLSLNERIWWFDKNSVELARSIAVD